MSRSEFSNKRVRCPACGARHGLAPFKGYEKAQYGYCHACGQFFPLPDMNYNPDHTNCDAEKMPGNSQITSLQKKQQKPVSKPRYINPYEVLKNQVNIDCNIFFKCLLNLGIPEYHLFKWNIGSTADGGTLFYYQDIKGNFINAKKIIFKPDLHRDKEILPSFIFSKSQGYKTCLYGEFQLKESRQVILVESEKTAILGAYAMSDRTWIATGGASGLTAEKAKVLKGASVTIAFDADNAGRINAEKAKALLCSLGIRSTIKDLFEDSSDGRDLADYLINILKKLSVQIQQLTPNQREAFEEKAGVLEYMSGRSKYEAELQALKMITKKDYIHG
jgi:hypothetical protein